MVVLLLQHVVRKIFVLLQIVLLLLRIVSVVVTTPNKIECDLSYTIIVSKIGPTNRCVHVRRVPQLFAKTLFLLTFLHKYSLSLRIRSYTYVFCAI